MVSIATTNITHLQPTQTNFYVPITRFTTNPITDHVPSRKRSSGAFVMMAFRTFSGRMIPTESKLLASSVVAAGDLDSVAWSCPGAEAIVDAAYEWGTTFERRIKTPFDIVQTRTKIRPFLSPPSWHHRLCATRRSEPPHAPNCWPYRSGLP